jgi:hypothetical protein
MKDEQKNPFTIHPSSFRLHPLFVVLAKGFDLDINASGKI